MHLVRAAVLLALSAATPLATPLFLNVLPAGQDGTVTVADNDARHERDQLPLYRDIIRFAIVRV